MSGLLIRGRVAKEAGRWCVTLVYAASGKVYQRGDGGWDTWDDAFGCAHSVVRAIHNDRVKRGLE